ncbi:MAG: hypothetical protein J6K15_04545, partial [Lachnospiraceae bacterium]|nr:hypothetical protein [Lachnospiraceae bacterium]
MVRLPTNPQYLVKILSISILTNCRPSFIIWDKLTWVTLDFLWRPVKNIMKRGIWQNGKHR